MATTRAQIPELFPDHFTLPVVSFRPTGRRYLLLNMANRGVRGHVQVELIQYQYDVSRGDIYGMRAFTQNEPCGTRWMQTSHGQWVQKYWLLRFDQVDCRFMPVGEIDALREALRSVVSARRRHDMMKYLELCREENVPEHIEKNFKFGTPTSPEYPVIEPDEPKPSIIVPGKPFGKQ